MQSVEGMKKLFLGVFLPFDELNVINQDEIRSPITVSKSLHAVLTNGSDQIIGKRFSRHIKHARFRINLQAVVPDRLHEMGFP